jgi:hypothetical protein
MHITIHILTSRRALLGCRVTPAAAPWASRPPPAQAGPPGPGRLPCPWSLVKLPTNTW